MAIMVVLSRFEISSNWDLQASWIAVAAVWVLFFEAEQNLISFVYIMMPSLVLVHLAYLYRGRKMSIDHITNYPTTTKVFTWASASYNYTMPRISYEATTGNFVMVDRTSVRTISFTFAPDLSLQSMNGGFSQARRILQPRPRKNSTGCSPARHKD